MYRVIVQKNNKWVCILTTKNQYEAKRALADAKHKYKFALIMN